MTSKPSLILGLISVLPIMFGLTIKIQIVNASETVYIKANGSIEPSTAPIFSLDNITYTFTGDMNVSLVVERNNIVIDGSNHIIQGSNIYKSKGINIEERINVTIKNIWIRNFYYGIYLSKSSGNNISENNITKNTHGIDFCGNSHYNIVFGNYVANNSRGIYLFGGSSNNKVSRNIIMNNLVGIEFDQSSNNVISENNVVNNKRGLYLYTNSYNNIIVGNNITENTLYGVDIYWCSYNSIFHNNFLHNTLQAHVSSSLDQNY